MKKIYIIIAFLSIFILVSTVNAQLEPNLHYRIYTNRGDWFWSWQIEYKTNKMVNNTKYRGIKDKIIDKIGFDSFYNITFSTLVDTFKKTGIMWKQDFTLGLYWIPRSIDNWIEIKVIITALFGGR